MIRKRLKKSQLGRRRLNRPSLLVWSAVVLATGSGVLSTQGKPSGPGMPQGSVRAQLFDVCSGQPLGNTDVEVTSDNGIRCIQPPCPTNDKKWSGHSDDAGVVSIPRTAIQAVTFVNAKDYRDAALPEDAVKSASGTTRLELYPAWLGSEEHDWTRGYKLLDARSGKVLASIPVRIEFPASDWPARHGGISGLAAKTNLIGYVFFSFLRKPKKSEAQALPSAPEADWLSPVAWVMVPGYRKARVNYFEGSDDQRSVVRLQRL